jgi:hypothetical protein
MERSLAPDRQAGIQLFGSTAELGRRNRDLRPEQSLQDGNRLARGDPHAHTISARAMLGACSVRYPFSRALG